MVDRLYLRSDTAALDAAAEARQRVEGSHRGEIAELLRAWGAGEITTLQKVLRILRETHVECARRYRDLSIVPRPPMIQASIDYYTHAASALDHAIGVLESCKSRRG